MNNDNELKQLVEQMARLSIVSTMLHDAITFCETHHNTAAAEDFRKSHTWLERAEKQMCGEHEPAVRRELTRTMNLPPEEATPPLRTHPERTPPQHVWRDKKISETTGWGKAMDEFWQEHVLGPINSLKDWMTKIASIPMLSETGEELSKFDKTIEAARKCVAKIAGTGLYTGLREYEAIRNEH